MTSLTFTHAFKLYFFSPALSLGNFTTTALFGCASHVLFVCHFKDSAFITWSEIMCTKAQGWPSLVIPARSTENRACQCYQSFLRRDLTRKTDGLNKSNMMQEHALSFRMRPAFPSSSSISIEVPHAACQQLPSCVVLCVFLRKLNPDHYLSFLNFTNIV